MTTSNPVSAIPSLTSLFPLAGAPQPVAPEPPSPVTTDGERLHRPIDRGAIDVSRIGAEQNAPGARPSPWVHQWDRAKRDERHRTRARNSHSDGECEYRRFVLAVQNGHVLFTVPFPEPLSPEAER
ncbi:MAG TPA: hypothetical protein VD903_16650 [Pseudonocardia sp.]|nr:hypothetical protein [Pseudonocardia sp.]